DLLDDRGVHREGPLDTHAEADLAHGEGLPGSAALAADHDALEDLDAGAVALDDADVHLDGVAGTELGDVVAQRVGVECVQGVHRGNPRPSGGSYTVRTAGGPGCPSRGAAAPAWSARQRALA